MKTPAKVKPKAKRARPVETTDNESDDDSSDDFVVTSSRSLRRKTKHEVDVKMEDMDMKIEDED